MIDVFLPFLPRFLPSLYARTLFRITGMARIPLSPIGGERSAGWPQGVQLSIISDDFCGSRTACRELCLNATLASFLTLDAVGSMFDLPG